MLDHDLLKAQERHAALARELEARRVARLAQVSRPRHTLFHSRMLDRLGAWLIAWGWSLRARYGALERTSGESITAFAE
jgi:hypothetical protein